MLITTPPGHTIHHVPYGHSVTVTQPDLRMTSDDPWAYTGEPVQEGHWLDDPGDCWCLPHLRLLAAWCGSEPVYEIHAYHQ